MSGWPSIEDFAWLLAVPEERMNTHEERYEAGLQRLGRKIADRDKQQLLVVAGMHGLATAILGVLIGVLALN